jgi:hypothetical protein
MMVSDESFVSTLVRVNIQRDGKISQDLKMDTMNGLVKQT